MERIGQCHCGSFRVIATGEPDRVYLCHCKACQRRTGTAFHFRCDVSERTGAARWRTEDLRARRRQRLSDSISFLPELRQHVVLGSRPQPGSLRGCGRGIRHVSLSCAQRLDLGGSRCIRGLACRRICSTTSRVDHQPHEPVESGPDRFSRITACCSAGWWQINLSMSSGLL